VTNDGARGRFMHSVNGRFCSMMRMTLDTALGLMLVAAAAGCAVHHEKSPPATAPVVQPLPIRVEPLKETESKGLPPTPGPIPKQGVAEPPLPPPLPRATEVDGSPRPYVTAELSPPSGNETLGLTLTVLRAPAKVSGGFEPSYPAEGNDPTGVAGVMVSPRWYRLLAWEQVHGSWEGYEAGPEDPEPSFTFSGRVVRQPMELLVFGEDAFWKATVRLLPCAKKPCRSYVSPVNSVVVVVPAGTAEHFGVGEGWSIALGG